ncbi:arginyl-tRNA--protein transferase 2 isoform X2 [Jatropha curcas]|uniref:arginyl-tRNA--protein transferase 2 isoform X2 n=1 Tax=Jatropha curcas TaxID=180498 RepID=UPI0005FAF438|nr:arginyl-tRNA--protein transferase 2 isoform X2 [Jatropha curcas]
MAGKMRRSEASSSSSSNSRGETVVVDCGRRRSSCGYCRSNGRTSISHGLWAHSVTVDDYQDLLDRGWRRSGCFLYKPEMEKTCCPSYTIRLKASDFVPSKDQLRVFRRVQRLLDGTLDMKKAVEDVEDQNSSKSTCSCACHEVSSSETKETSSVKHEEMNNAENIANYLSDQVDNAIHTWAESGEFPCNIQLPKASVKQVSQAKRKLLVEGAEELMYSSNIAFQIVASVRRAQSAGKDARHGSGDDTLSPKIIAEKLAASLNQLPETSGLSIRACNGHINYYKSTTQASSSEGTQIVSGSKESAAGCKRKACCMKKSVKHPQGKRRKLEIRLKRSSFDLEEFELYRRYQMKVHNDTPDHVSESSYRRFLVDTPLIFVPPSGDGRVPPCGFGSFHQQYVIDGKLVAVGVIDILPKCLSSKYLFWDPDFAFVSLGKYSALQEIGWVKENQVHCPSLQYYYLGYYIHSCSKMRYKAAYCPSELLCPLRFQWIPFDIARPLLDRKPYVVLSDYALLKDGDSLPLQASENSIEVQHDDNGPESSGQMLENGDLGDILIGLKGSRVRYKDLQQAFGPRERSFWDSQLHRYKRVVGAELSERMVYLLG